MFQYTIFILIAPFAAAGSIALAFYTRRAKQTPGASSLFWCFSAIAGFLIVSTFELLFNILELKIFFARLDLLFFALLSVTWLAFSLDYTGNNHLLSPRFFWIVLLIPISTVILTLTGDYHNLIWQSVTVIDASNFTQLQMQYGVWFWVHLVYSYALIIIGSSLIAKEYFALHNVYRKQSIWMVVGATLPLFVNLGCVFSLIPGLHKDFSPIGFALGGIGFAIGIFKYQLLDIVPIARSTLIDKMKDGVIVLNLREQVVDINPAAQVILGLSSQHIIGNPINTFFSSWPAYFNQSSLTTDHQEVELYHNGELQYFEVRITELSSRTSQVIGLLLTLHDITERKVLLEKVRKLAQLDTVTGLFNRRHFISLAVKELARTITEGLPCSLILVDLDYFKLVNDTFGHLSGDIVLQKVTAAMQNSLRAPDIIARFGGDEFVVLLPETDHEKALLTAERLRKLVEANPIVTERGEIHVTLSMGISSYAAGESASLDQLLEHADRALYLSKEAGRNRATAWVDETVPAVEF